MLSQQEQNLSNNNLISFRRQLQIDQKKEILSKLFNNQNKLNLDYITDNDNNSIDSYTNRNQYNVIDNNLISLDLHSLINNDMEEVNYLLEEDGNFKILQEEVKQNIFHKKIVTDNQQSDENGHGQFDYERFQSLTAKNWTRFMMCILLDMLVLMLMMMNTRNLVSIVMMFLIWN